MIIILLLTLCSMSIYYHFRIILSSEIIFLGYFFLTAPYLTYDSIQIALITFILFDNFFIFPFSILSKNDIMVIVREEKYQ